MLMCPNLSVRLTFLKTVDICATSSFLNGRCNFSHLPKIFAGKKSKRLSAVSADLRRRRNPFNRNLRVCNLLRIICDRLIREVRVWQMHSWVFFSCYVTSANLPLRDWENLCSIYAPASQSQNDNLEKFCLMTWQQQPQNLNLTWCTIWTAGTCWTEIRAAS